MTITPLSKGFFSLIYFYSFELCMQCRYKYPSGGIFKKFDFIDLLQQRLLPCTINNEDEDEITDSEDNPGDIQRDILNV